jgi:hypothetical protein
MRPEFAVNVRRLAAKSPAAVAQDLDLRNHRVARRKNGALNKDPTLATDGHLPLSGPFQVERLLAKMYKGCPAQPQKE